MRIISDVSRKELEDQRTSLGADHARFKPDFEQAKAALEAAPFDTQLGDRYRDIATYLQSIEANLATINFLLRDEWRTV